MKKIILVLLFIIAIAFSLNTSNISFVAPLLVASGDSAYALPLSNELMLFNPSLIPNFSKYNFSFGYNDLFGLNLLPVSQFVTFVPGTDYSQIFAFLTTSSNTFSYIDSLSFRQSTYCYAAALKSENFNFGFSIFYNDINGTLESTKSLSSNLGIFSSSGNLNYSILFKNILNYTFDSSDSSSVEISPVALFSFAYKIDSSKSLTAKLETSDGFNYGLGFVYQAFNNFKFLAGINFENLTFNYISFGISAKYNFISINYALSYNGVFGNFYNYLTFGAKF